MARTKQSSPIIPPA
jgi:hypothetical protein